MSWSDHIFPHGPLRELAPEFWEVSGTLGRSPLTRNMALWRSPEGLVIHSAVCLDEPGMAALEALGTPAVLIVPNGFHRADAAAFKRRYPDLRVVAPRASRAKVELLLAVDADAEEALPELGIEALVPAGLKPGELVYRVPLAHGHALVITDALFHHDDVPGPSGWVLKHVTASTGFFGITRLGRLMMLQDKRSFADFLRELAAPPDLRLISVAHGRALIESPSDRLRQAAAAVHP